MNNFIFKSPRRLIKNSPIQEANLAGLITQIHVIQGQNRHLRQDLVDVKLMLNKLLIDKHLQMQVDNYFNDEESKDNVIHTEQDLD